MRRLLSRIMFTRPSLARLRLLVVAVAGTTLLLDFLTGPAILFPIVYVLPIGLAAWYGARWLAIGLAIVMPLAHLALELYMWGQTGALAHVLVNATIRMAVLLLIAALVGIAPQYLELQRKVRVLEGFLPICSHCKRIRGNNAEWHQLEQYISTHSEAKFTHSLCPDCVRKYYGDLDGDRGEQP